MDMDWNHSCVLLVRADLHLKLTCTCGVSHSGSRHGEGDVSPVLSSNAHVQVAFPQFRDTAEQPPSPSLHAYYEVRV